ncbi:MAG: diguanylate cyclase, partial [Spirochaetaceae bacterium]|nr:diguanylate cyclase [Spirochaetaceae bacterium]
SLTLFAEDSVSTPIAESAVIDLRNYDFDSDGPVALNGEWAFHWDTAVSYENFFQIISGTPDHYINVPSYWDKLSDVDPRITAQGVATYRLKILLPHMRRTMAIKFLNITPNADVFVDGVRVVEIGDVNPNPQYSKSGNMIQILPIEVSGPSVDVVVSISNFHNVSGGLNRPIDFGFYNDIRESREHVLSAEALFLGGLMLMGLYQIALFMLDRKRKAPLFMALLCFLSFFFAGFKHEMVLLSLFPGWDGEIRTKFIFSALALAPMGFTYYAYNIYPVHFIRWVNRVILAIASVFTVVILSTPKAFFTRFLIPMEAVILVVAVYNITALTRGYIRGRDRRLLFSLGGLVFLLASIVFSILDNAFAVVFQSVAGIFFVFILYQAFLQAYIFSHAFQEIDHLSIQKSKLEKRNVELFSLSYIDSLTGSCNRRLFDDYLASNWRVNSLSDRSLGMILIDIDHFKMYNDYYGHRQGDVCLLKVCELIRAEMNGLGLDTLARYGGEEFTVIISDTDEMSLFRIAERFRKAVEAGRIEHPASAISDVVTISLGCACIIPSMDMDPESLLDAADKALFEAKEKGRNRTEVYDVVGEETTWGPRLV